ncbi:MAG: hypothetical protein DMG13_11000 [Acidobacteria bacterium]|nr:MAG: hypothetical protein DMG13_11000 [Acidobacteriota bacterium]
MKTLMNCAVILTVMAILTSAIAQAPPANGRGGQRSPSGFSTNNSRPNCCDYKERPPVFFHEDWKEIPIATPITQDHVKDPNLILSLHGPGKDGVRKSHHTVPVDDPFYTFSGPAKGNWAVSLHHKNSYVDLTGVAKIRWRINVSGLRSLHVILKTADGKWYVSTESDGPTLDWREHEFNVREMHWQNLDIRSVVETGPVDKIDLSKVDEIGYTDLMIGGDVSGAPSGAAASRVDWIEVIGWPIKRDAPTNQ